MEQKFNKALVVGSGISGIGALELLKGTGCKICLYDGNKNLTQDAVREKLGNDLDTEIYIGDFPSTLLDEIDLAVLSPGVPTDLPFVKEMRAKGIRIWGEIELAYQNGRGTILAITGTNGKTTTTTLMGEICRLHQQDVFVVGNIGTPYTKAARETTEQSLVVAEISSFQLETVEAFTPAVSAILNITPDHLDRHKTFAEYSRVKKLITKNQKADSLCVLNYEDPQLKEFGESLHTNVLFFSSKRTLERGIYLEDGTIWKKDQDGKVRICAVQDLRILGVHNYENIMAAAAIALGAGIPLETVQKGILEFKGVEHRIEFVNEQNGVAYYNDSKGTNPDAAIKAIQAMNRPTWLIAGGYDKQSDYKEWINSFDGKVKCLVLLGETKEKIADAARACGFTDYVFVETLEEAAAYCKREAKAGDAVLLSPACASWDMFSNYEVRGRKFKEYISN